MCGGREGKLTRCAPGDRQSANQTRIQCYRIFFSIEKCWCTQQYVRVGVVYFGFTLISAWSASNEQKKTPIRLRVNECPVGSFVNLFVSQSDAQPCVLFEENRVPPCKYEAVGLSLRRTRAINSVALTKSLVSAHPSDVGAFVICTSIFTRGITWIRKGGKGVERRELLTNQSRHFHLGICNASQFRNKCGVAEKQQRQTERKRDAELDWLPNQEGLNGQEFRVSEWLMSERRSLRRWAQRQKAKPMWKS